MTNTKPESAPRYTVAQNGHDVLQDGWLFASVYGLEPRQAQSLCERLNSAAQHEAEIARQASALEAAQARVTTLESDCEVMFQDHTKDAQAFAEINNELKAQLEAATRENSELRAKAGDWERLWREQVGEKQAVTRERDAANARIEQMCDEGGLEARYACLETLAGPRYNPLGGEPVESCISLRIDLLERDNATLRTALRRAYEVMEHFGNVLNGMDCVDEIAKDTGVPTEYIDESWAIVRAALSGESQPSPQPATQVHGFVRESQCHSRCAECGKVEADPIHRAWGRNLDDLRKDWETGDYDCTYEEFLNHWLGNIAKGEQI